MRVLAISLLCFVPLVASAAVLDRVAVVVGNQVITESELIEELRLEDFMTSRPLDLSPAERRAAAERLVDQQLIRQEMEIAQYKAPQPNAADSMLRDFRRQHYPTESAFRAALQRYGITEDEVRQYLLWELTVIRFTDARFHPDLQPSEPSSNREAQPAAPPPHTRVPTAQPQSADRQAAPPAPGDTVDQALDAWLKQARSTTKITFKPEAFQ